MSTNPYNFKQMIKESGLSQSSIAKKVGISRQHLHDIVKSNRKSKYSEKIFELLKQAREARGLPKLELELKGSYKQETLPMIFPDDLLRILQGSTSLSLLSKPFYAQYPFINLDEDDHHFCLRLTDIFTEQFYIPVGVFRLSISLNLKPGQIVLMYLPDVEKVMAGRLDINPDTKAKFVVNAKSAYALRVQDLLLAECTQIVHYLP